MGQCPQSFVSVPPYCIPAYVPAITNGGIFESLSISEYQRIKGPFPIGRSTAEIKLLQEQQQQQWTIKEIGQ